MVMRSLVIALLVLLAWPGHAAAELVISEIAANPSRPEPGGEFVVVDNARSMAVSLDGVRLTDANGALRGVVPVGTSLEPWQRIALQPSSGASAYTCAAMPHRALLTAWPALNNDGDAVVLERADGTVIDRVAYPRDAFVVEGLSLQRDLFGRWAPSSAEATPCAVAPPRPGTLRLAASSYGAGERDGSVTLAVSRSGGTNGRVGVAWTTADGSARAGADYERSSGTVDLAAMQTTATFRVPLRDDSVDEPDESFTVVLGATEGGATLGEPARASVVVRDDDPPAPPVATPVVAAPAIPTPPAGAAPVAAAPSPGLPAVAAPARATLAVARWQPAARRRQLAAVVACDRDCELAVSGRIAIGGGRSVRLVATRRSLSARTPAVVGLRVPDSRLRALRRALRRRGSLVAVVVAKPADGERVERRTRIR